MHPSIIFSWSHKTSFSTVRWIKEMLGITILLSIWIQLRHSKKESHHFFPLGNTENIGPVMIVLRKLHRIEDFLHKPPNAWSHFRRNFVSVIVSTTNYWVGRISTLVPFCIQQKLLLPCSSYFPWSPVDLFPKFLVGIYTTHISRLYRLGICIKEAGSI